jgi:DNA-binding MarR family transcriptional regulator
MTLDDRLGYQIKAAQQALRVAIDAGLRDAGLTMSQYALLAAVGDAGAASNAELASRAFVTAQAAHEVLRALERRGLVERPEGVGRGRMGPIRLTPVGRGALRTADERVAAIEGRIVARIGEAQASALTRLLRAATGALVDGS